MLEATRLAVYAHCTACTFPIMGTQARQARNWQAPSQSHNTLSLVYSPFVQRTFLGLRFILKFLWHLERQNLKTEASLRTKVMPWPGYTELRLGSGTQRCGYEARAWCVVAIRQGY